MTSEPGFTYWRGVLPSNVSGDSWDQRESRSEYAVLAETAADIQATVRFATSNNLRLAVKGTGHSFQGKSSAAGSLMLWMHRMNATEWYESLNICGKTYEYPVKVSAGSQFHQTHKEAEKRGRIELSRMCPSVGFGGFATGGGHCLLSRSYGTGSTSILAADIVLADGSLVYATPCNEYADLLRTIRGRGGGTFEITTSLMYRTHEKPKLLGVIKAETTVENLEEMMSIVEDYFINLRDNVTSKDMLQHLGGYLILNPLNMMVTLEMAYVGISNEDCHKLFGNMSDHMEISCTPAPNFIDLSATFHNIEADEMFFSKITRYFNESLFENEETTAKFSNDIKHIMELNSLRVGNFDTQKLRIMLQWGLSGASTTALEDIGNTTMNPVLVKAVGMLFWDSSVSSEYFISGGDIPPSTAAQVRNERANTYDWFDKFLGPDTESNLNIAGSDENNWQHRFWGTHYPFLLSVKDKYDPYGLFIVIGVLAASVGCRMGTVPSP